MELWDKDPRFTGSSVLLTHTCLDVGLAVSVICHFTLLSYEFHKVVI